MLKLYIRTSCSFCTAVHGKLKELNLDFEKLNINDEKNKNELIEIGGKQQVPYFVDEEKSMSSYEAKDIINYLEKTYGTGESLPEDFTISGVCPIV